MSPSPSSARKVGLLLLVALALGMAAIFLVGEKRNLFSRKSDYFIRFDSVPGLSAGSNVQLDGVGVGSVAAIDLSENVEQNQIDRRRTRIGEPRERGLATLQELDAVPLGLQVEGQAACEVLLVLNDEDAFVHRHFREASG